MINHDDRPLWIQNQRIRPNRFESPACRKVVYWVCLQRSSLRFCYNKPHLLRYEIFLKVIEAIDSGAARVRRCMLLLLYNVLIVV